MLRPSFPAKKAETSFCNTILEQSCITPGTMIERHNNDPAPDPIRRKEPPTLPLDPAPGLLAASEIITAPGTTCAEPGYSNRAESTLGLQPDNYAVAISMSVTAELVLEPDGPTVILRGKPFGPELERYPLRNRLAGDPQRQTKFTNEEAAIIVEHHGGYLLIEARERGVAAFLRRNLLGEDGADSWMSFERPLGSEGIVLIDAPNTPTPHQVVRYPISK